MRERQRAVAADVGFPRRAGRGDVAEGIGTGIAKSLGALWEKMFWAVPFSS